jgi:hypothetical protein
MQRGGATWWISCLAIAMASGASAKCGVPHCGDVNGDCALDVGDVVTVLRASVGLVDLDDEPASSGDVAPAELVHHWNGVDIVLPGGDGSASVEDAVQLLRMVVGLRVVEGCYGTSPSPQAITPETACAGGNVVLRVQGSYLPLSPDDGDIHVGTHRATFLDASQSHADILLPRVEASSRPLEIVVRKAGKLGILPGALTVTPCEDRPRPQAVTPGEAGHSRGDLVEVSGENLGCVNSAWLRGSVSGVEIALQDVLVGLGGSVTGRLPRLTAAPEERFDVMLASDCGVGSLPSAMEIFDPARPSILSAEPMRIPVAGGELALTGEHLNLITRLRDGNAAAGAPDLGFETLSPTRLRLTAVPPNPTPALRPWLLVEPWNHSVAGGALSVRYEADHAISCDSLLVHAGQASGGIEVQLTGTDLEKVQRAQVGPAPAWSFEATGPGQGRFTLPPLPAPGVYRVYLLRHDAIVSECDDRFYAH